MYVYGLNIYGWTVSGLNVFPVLNSAVFLSRSYADLRTSEHILRVCEKIKPGCVNWKKVNKEPKLKFKRIENGDYAVVRACVPACMGVSVHLLCLLQACVGVSVHMRRASLLSVHEPTQPPPRARRVQHTHTHAHTRTRTHTHTTHTHIHHTHRHQHAQHKRRHQKNTSHNE